MSLQRKINRSIPAMIQRAVGQAHQVHKAELIKQDKGKMGGSCNRTDCQQPGATWFNTSTRAYYCEPCALDITTFAKRCDGFHICFPSTGDAAQDATMKFGVEP